ncbi:MAG TPA: hypothetical protein VH540_10900 [Ktedonobacterales bacterium]|jgi:bacteriocin-like protein
MENENKKNEKKQAENTPATQVELSDEDLKQVVGGGIKLPDSPAVHRDTIIIEE